MQVWVSDGAGGHRLMSRAEVLVQAESFTYIDLYVGVDGARMPDSCR